MGKAKLDKSEPMYKALSQVKSAYIMGYISGGLTLVLVLVKLRFPDSPIGIDYPLWFVFANAFIIILISILLAAKKSRVCAILLLTYTSISTMTFAITGPSTAAGGLVLWIIFFGVAYVYGIIGTFTYQRLKQKEPEGNKGE